MLFEVLFTTIFGILIIYTCMYISKIRGDSSKSLTQEEINFLRIYILCQKYAAHAVRLLFDKHVPTSVLAKHLLAFKTPNLFRWNSNEKCILYSGSSVTSADFDITLLYKLIRNTCKIAKPSSGWNSRPLPGDKLPSDDIERVRFYRNEMAHNTELRISDQEFQDQWNELSQAINRLSQGAMKSEISALEFANFIGSQTNLILSMEKNISIIKHEMNNLQDEMLCYQDGLNDLQDAVMNCRTDIVETSQRHIPDHIRKRQLRELDEWKRLDIVFCDKTRGYETAREDVKKHRSVTFIGCPGSGKTAIARHIALLFERSGCEIIPICKEEEIMQYGNINIRQVFVLDDVLGILGLNVIKFDNIASCKKKILNSISDSSKILFTCRKSVYNEAIILKPFVLENIVDLESKTNELNEKEKRNILTNHCVKAGIDKKFYADLSLTTAKLMFPLLCQFFAVNVNYQMLGSNFFAKPFEYLLEELSKLQKTNTAQYTSLVLCLVNNRKISINNMPSQHVKERVYNSCGLDRGTADRKIFDALSNIEGTYVMVVDNEFSFIHDSIYEAIAYHYGQDFLEQILEYMPSNFIAKKLIVFKNHSNDDLNIQITEGNFPKLAERLHVDLESEQLFDVFMNKALEFKPFLDMFIQIMKKKPYTDFKKIFLAPSNTSCHHLKNYDGENDVRRYNDEIRQRELLTDKRERILEGHFFHNINYRIRVISWIVYYGHTQLLKEIINHVNVHNESTDLVFDSNIEEQARLLVLAIFNGDPDLVELILKYVKKESINATPMYESDDHLNANYHRTFSPLTAACHIDSLRIVELLVQSGANVNLPDYDQTFPICVASENGKCDIVKYLLQIGANVYKNEALSIATKNGYFDVVNCLVGAGSDVNMIGEYNMTPIFLAALFGYTEIVRFLVENGADVNICDENNKSPLFAASEEGHSDIVMYLIKSGGDVNICDDEGKSPFLASVGNGHFDAVKIFVDNSVLVNIQLSDKPLPLRFALSKDRVEIATFLLQNGADYRMKKEYEISTMQIALWKNHFDILHQIVILENRREPSIGNLQLFQLLVDLCEFQVFPRTSCSINMTNIRNGAKFRHRSLALLLFISEVTDGDGIKHLVKLGLGSKLDDKKKHLLLEYAITESDVNKRVEKVKSLFTLCEASNLRDHNSVSLLECTRKLFEQNKALLKESEYRWGNFRKKLNRQGMMAAASFLLKKPYEVENKTVSKQDIDEYWTIMIFLKQRIRRFSV